jgi:hypothetical protein
MSSRLSARPRNDTLHIKISPRTRASIASARIVDTIKMIAYRAETAMAQIVRQMMSRRTEVDLIPDQEAKTLTVRLQPLTNT